MVACLIIAPVEELKINKYIGRDAPSDPMNIII
jgi:hypothetical protein